MGGNSLKILPLQPNSYIILPPLNKLPPHSYINLAPIDKLPPILTSKWEDFREDIRPGNEKVIESERNVHKESKDDIDVSDRKGENCVTGAYFSQDPKQAADYGEGMGGR